MPLRAFISYSHADEKALERLHKHLAVLRRDGDLSAWYDHEISPGADIDSTITEELNQADLFLALVSPDYLASRYCYEKEFQYAQRLSASGKLRIVPVITEPCDWLATPLSAGMALPKDGKPISEWTNANNAYLDVVNGIRRLVNEINHFASLPPPEIAFSTENSERANRRFRVKKDFDTIQKAEFADETFDTLQLYFRSASAELDQASDDLRTKFEVMSPTAFTCSIVNRASQRHREAHITVRNNKGRHSSGNITYVYERHADNNMSNGSIRVEADEYNMYLVTDNFYGAREPSKLAPKQASEWLWNQYVGHVGIEYE